MSPRRTTALPDECESEEGWHVGARAWDGRRPDGRLGVGLVRVAWRKECGESLANVWAGKEVDGVDEVLTAISLGCWWGFHRGGGDGIWKRTSFLVFFCLRLICI